MDVSDASIDPKEVELTEHEAAPAETNKTVDVKITFCKHVGWDGVLMLLFSLGIAALFLYITFLYTKGFQAWHRPWVWLFLVFAVFYLLLIVKLLWTWKKMATTFTKLQDTKKVENQTKKRSVSATERAKRAVGNAKNIYEKMQVNGPWFLWKLYLSEVTESIQQCLNLITVYSCSVPVEMSVFICFLLAIDSTHTAWTMIHKNTPMRRDRQLKIDAMVDFLCVAVPLCVIWFGYQIPISITEMLQITFIPTFFLLAKLDDIFEEIVHQRTAACVIKDQVEHSVKMRRRRKSLFQQVAHIQMAEEQEKNIPRPVRFVAGTCKGCFGLFFLIVAITHLSMLFHIENSEDCDGTT